MSKNNKDNVYSRGKRSDLREEDNIAFEKRIKRIKYKDQLTSRLTTGLVALAD